MSKFHFTDDWRDKLNKNNSNNNRNNDDSSKPPTQFDSESFERMRSQNLVNHGQIQPRKANNSSLDSQPDPEETREMVKNYKENTEIEKPMPELESEDEDQQGFYNQRRKMFYVMTTCIIVMSGVYFFLHFLESDKTVPLQKRLGQVTYIGKADIGGPWRMFNTKGIPFGSKDLAGKYYLIYFGFTLCPDVCPQSLNKLAKMLKRIRESKEFQYFDIECIFVSVDPDRDNSQRINQYCKIFDDQIIGVTGISNNDPELKDMLKKFKIHSSKIYLSEEDEKEDRELMMKNSPQVQQKMSAIQPSVNAKYSLDHTIVTYLMGPENNFLTFLSANLDVDEMYNIVIEDIMGDLTKWMKQVPNAKTGL